MNRRRSKRRPRRRDDVDHLHRVIVVSDNGWRDDESLSIDIPMTNITSNREGDQHLFHSTSIRQNQDLSSTRRRPESSLIHNDTHLGAERLDDGPRCIPQRPCRYSNREGKELNPSTIHLNYSIPKSNHNEKKEPFGRPKRFRNSLNKIKMEGETKATLDATLSHPFFQIFKRFFTFRRRENAPVYDNYSEYTKVTSLRNGDVPEYVVTNFGRVGDVGGDAPKGNPIRRTFRRMKFRQIEKPENEWVDIWSEISSLGGSYRAQFEAIDVSFPITLG